MSKITQSEIQAAIEALFDSGWEMDVSDDVNREFDKRMPVVMKIISALDTRVKTLEAKLAATPGNAVDTHAVPSGGPVAAPKAKLTVRMGGLKKAVGQ